MTDQPQHGQLFLVRHTPVAVPSDTCYGQTDVALDETKFAQMLPNIHAQLPLRAVMLCSPLSRCLRLAKALSILGPGRSLLIEPNLIEHNFGRWEGMRWDDIPREEIDAWATDYLNYSPPCGESVAAMAERSAEPTLNKCRADIPFIVISHAGPLAAISAHLSGTQLAANIRGQAQGNVKALFAPTTTNLEGSNCAVIEAGAKPRSTKTSVNSKRLHTDGATIAGGLTLPLARATQCAPPDHPDSAES